MSRPNPGRYIIRSKANPYIGLPTPGSPGPVVTLPGGVTQEWTLTGLGQGLYTFTIDGQHIVIRDGTLFADRHESPQIFSLGPAAKGGACQIYSRGTELYLYWEVQETGPFSKLQVKPYERGWPPRPTRVFEFIPA